MPSTALPFSPERLQQDLKALPEARRWWVAFSGGADSTALLHALACSRDQLSASVHALHVDHGLHPDSGTWLAHCREFCSKLGIPLHTEKVIVSHNSGQGTEAEARRLRYQVATKLLTTGDTLLTGHHFDDQAETLLLNLMRGSGVDGLAGMPRVRTLGEALLARPLLDYSGASLRAYLAAQDIDWIEDSSNLDQAYDRNFIRQNLLPALESRWPGARRNLALSAHHCREASDFLAASTTQLLEPCLEPLAILDLACLQQTLPAGSSHATLKLILRQWLRLNEAPPLPGERLEELRRQIASEEPSGHLTVHWDSWSVRRHAQRLWLQHDQQVCECPTLTWLTDGDLDLGPVLGKLRLEGQRQPPRMSLRVTSREPGARIACLPGGHHKSVKHVFQENSVPPWLRASIPLVFRGNQLVAVADWVIDEEFHRELADLGLQLAWRPADPLLRVVASNRG